VNLLLRIFPTQKPDARVETSGIGWDVGKRARVPGVFTCDLYYSECMHGGQYCGMVKYGEWKKQTHEHAKDAFRLTPDYLTSWYAYASICPSSRV